MMEFGPELDEHDTKRWQQWDANVARQQQGRVATKDDGRRVDLVIDHKSVEESLRQYEMRIMRKRHALTETEAAKEQK